MARIGTHRLTARGRLILVLAVFALFLCGVGTASASSAQLERQGAEALRELEAGRVSCAELSDEQFEHIGDYAMGRMMGATAERQMHEVLGRRFSGCGGGTLPAGFGRMMMGGRYWGETGDGGSDGPSAAAMIGMMAVFIVAVGAAVFWLSRRRPRGPLDTLQRRFAAGELTSEEYEERRRLLGGELR